MKYQIGDKVRVINTLSEDQDNVVDEMVALKGKNLVINDVGLDYYKLEGHDWFWNEGDIELNTTFKEGDITTNGDDKRKILGVCGEVYFLSHDNDFSKVLDTFFTEHELLEDGYKVVGKKEYKEMTVAEISEELGIEIKVIK